MDKRRIFARLRKAIGKKTWRQQEEITLKSRFYEDLNLNRLQLFLIINDLEEELGIRASGEDFQKISTVGQALQVVKTLLQKGGS